jgi:hypothetical protein
MSFAFCEDTHHEFVIASIVKYTNCQSYLELGIEEGITFRTITPLVKRAIGVDIQDKRTEKKGEFYKMTTDEFFKIFNEKIDIIFIDADHKFESVIRDFENSLKLLNKYGIIFLHDTDPINQMLLQPNCCNDSYKIIEYIYEKHPELNVVTLPLTIAGLTIVMRKEDRRVFKFI